MCFGAWERSGMSKNFIEVFTILKFSYKFAHDLSVQNGSDAFPNELMRFRNEAKPIWDTIQKHCKNAVII